MTLSVPESLKSIGHYVKIANEHQQRDPVIYYWCLMYAAQAGMEVDRQSPDAKKYLSSLLACLEETKKANKDDEAFSSDLVANAHIENQALKLFYWADTEDRAARFNKNVVKAFYTAGHLFDVLSLFSKEQGQSDQKNVEHNKYAKWKAAYIHNCLKNGETPVPGPMGGEGGPEFSGGEPGGAGPSTEGPSSPNAGGTFTAPDLNSHYSPASEPDGPQAHSTPQPNTPDAPAGDSGAGLSGLSTQDMMKAQKLCKYAVNSLEYEDVDSAIDNLTQALALLKSHK